MAGYSDDDKARDAILGVIEALRRWINGDTEGALQALEQAELTAHRIEPKRTKKETTP